MRGALAVAALALVVVGGFAIARARAVHQPLVLPAPSAVRGSSVALPIEHGTTALDFSQLLPPPPGGSPMPVEAQDVPSGADDPFLTVGDRARSPELRNGDMDRLRAGGQPRAIEVLLGIATDPAETEVMRSWAVQHLGLAWSLMDEPQRARVRATLQAIITEPTPGDLPPREALFALAQSDHAAERAIVIAAVDTRLGADDDPRLDLHVRLAGELGLAHHRARAEALTSHPSPAVAGAAREAVRRLAGEGAR